MTTTNSKRSNAPAICRKHRAGRLAMVCAGIWAAGCAGLGTGGVAAPGESSASVQNDCIRSVSIGGYTPLDDRNLILDGPGNRAYHVVLTTRSAYLANEFMIGVLDNDGDGRICPFGRDRILVDGPLMEEIPIRGIEEIDAETEEILKARFGIIEAAAEDAVTVTEIE